MIDDQVHFREPGFTKKGSIYTESKAAVAGGVTSYMDMPNTSPTATDIKSLENKYLLAGKSSLANYSFFMGVTKNNLEEVLRINNETICGISDDGLYFDDDEGILANYPEFLEKLFSRSTSLVALHCEEDAIIKENLNRFKKEYEENIPIEYHPLIRSEEACYLATKRVVEIAKKYKARFHALHISTKKEVELFISDISVEKKRITAEACVHHLWFSDEDYEKLGSLIKWNPAIKMDEDRKGLLEGLKSCKLDIIATDHTRPI